MRHESQQKGTKKLQNENKITNDCDRNDEDGPQKYPDGQIIALFPDVPWSGRLGEVASYMHIGQHGAADYRHVVATTEPATEKESAGLLNELRQVGYNNIRVIKRIKIEKL